MKSKYVLDAESSNRAIEAAIHTNAQLVLEFPSYPDRTLNGFLISGDQKALLMEITGKPALAPENLVHAACGATLYCDHRYAFQTEVPSAPQWGDTRSLVLARPATLTILERRRFVRARLAPSCRVNLEWTQAGRSHRKTAALLNVSADGLACRLPAPDAASLDIGQPIVVHFELPDAPAPFRFEAAACNQTQASGNQIIIGMRFAVIPRQCAQREALKRALALHPEQAVQAEALA